MLSTPFKTFPITIYLIFMTLPGVEILIIILSVP